MTFVQLAEKVLSEVNKPLSEKEIWDYAVGKGYNQLVETKGKTPWATIGAQMFVNIRDKSDSPFGRTHSKPKKFTLKIWSQQETEEVVVLNSPTQTAAEKKSQIQFEFLERQLHPFLSYFAQDEFKCYTKTINHSKSGKGEFGEWVHPDMVGCTYSFKEWGPEVTSFSHVAGNVAVKLFSFELKRKLNFTNLRAAFFQAVSNSSWANEGYLVAADIADEDDFQTELRRLSTAFGIGVIQLDITEPDSSEILFPARYKPNLDWDTVDKLTMNPDFKQFLTRVSNDIKTGQIIEERYDAILTKEALLKSMSGLK